MANGTDDDGARKRSLAASAREHALRAELIDVRQALQALLDEIDRVERASDRPAQSAVVTSVVTRGTWRR